MIFSSRFVHSSRTHGYTWLAVVGFLALVMALYGCAPAKPKIVERQIVYGDNIVGIPPKVPAGVVRYCWEEPMVDFEPIGPGLDNEGKWYNPAYIAVREVRQGKWRPCRKPLDEVKGETRNER